MSTDSRTEQLWEIVAARRMVAAQTAEELWIMVMSYLRWCDDNPLLVPEMIRSGKGGGTTHYMKKPQPYSIAGLCLFCGITPNYLSFCRSGNDMDFKAVAEQAIMIIQQQNIAWAMVGVFNPIITQKIHNINPANTEDDGGGISINVLAGNAPPLLENENEINLDS